MKNEAPNGSPPRMPIRPKETAYFGRPESPFRDRLFVIIFEADTRAGRWFDFALIAAILLSVAVVMLDSITTINIRYGSSLRAFEWFFTVAFTFEYIARLACVKHPFRYAKSRSEE